MKTVYACVNVCVCVKERKNTCVWKRGGEKGVERKGVENWQTETLQYILTDDTQIIRLASPTEDHGRTAAYRRDRSRPRSTSGHAVLTPSILAVKRLRAGKGWMEGTPDSCHAPVILGA